MVSRVVAAAAAMAVQLLGNAAGAATPAPVSDHVYALAQRWTCRSSHGAITAESGTRDGDAVVVRAEVRPAAGRPYAFEDRYDPERSFAGWRIAAGVGQSFAFDGSATGWTNDTWTVLGTIAGRPVRMQQTILPDGDRLRSFAQRGRDRRFVVYSASRCRLGETPPPATACIAVDMGPRLVEAAIQPPLGVPMDAPPGKVVVRVSLDENSHVTSAAIVESPSAVYNAAAISYARTSLYRTAARDCVPVASQFDLEIFYRAGHGSLMRSSER